MTFLEARERTRYRLNFMNQDRILDEGGLNGQEADCSYSGLVDPATGELHKSHASSREWTSGDGLDDDDSVQEWIKSWFECAIAEAIHEALEHFLVDGKVLLDPHDVKDCEILGISAAASRALWDLVEL